ncbi:putative reverse transcriptase domain-containing protein [Tanacetum coccineum]
MQFHLFKNGIDLSYTKWSKHGEKDEPSISSPKPVNATTEFVDDTDFASDIPTDGLATIEIVNATKDNFDGDDLVKFQELLLDAEKPLYKGCPDFTKLSVIVQLLNLKGKYGCSHKFFTELLGLLKKMLPAGNEMDDKDLTVCQTCGISRWKVDNKTHKVYENILEKRITDGVLCHPADSQAWRTIDEKFPEIAEDPRNLRLGISVDRVDVNRGNRHHNGKGKRINNKESKNHEDTRGRAGKIKKQKRNTTEEEGSSSQVNEQNGTYWKKFNIWYRKLRYWRHNSVPHCIDFMHVEKKVAESLVGTLLNVLGKTKDEQIQEKHNKY